MGTGTEALTLRDMEGLCDWCGDECHPNSQLCVVLSCNRCDDVNIYHQGCLEKFLKQYGFPSSRKIGFACPQGRGKGTKAAKECPGRIERSHPVIPKNEVKKKKALPPPMTEVMGKTASKPPAAKQQNNKAQQAGKPGLSAARKLAPPKPYELTARFAGSTRTPAPVASAWNRADGVNPAVLEPPPEPAESDYTATTAGQPKSAHVPVGLVLEEALTKAQKKNLARRKKKLQAVTADGQHSETGTAATDCSADFNTLDDWAAAEQQNQSGSSTQAGENLLAGHSKFVTDPARYLQLLGLLDSDSESDADPDAEEEDNNSTPDTPGELSYSSSTSSSSPGSVVSAAESPTPPSSVPPEVPIAVPIAVPVPVPIAIPLALPTAVPINTEAAATASLVPPAAAAAPAIAVKEFVDGDGDAALREALAQSMKQYELEQEINKQRLILAGELPVPKAAMAPVVATTATHAPLSFDFTQASAAPPLVIESPIRNAAPLLLPKLEPLATTMAGDATKVPAATNGGGYTYHQATSGLFGINGISLPQPKASVALNAATSAYAPMAHGHPTPASKDDDDDLGDLLALCGVAN